MHYYIDNKPEEYKYTDKYFVQKVIDKQKQSLYYSYETLCHLLSAAENFAGLKNEQYQGYNISLATTYEDLKSELVWELHCFQLSKKTYEKKYGKYIYPDGLPKEKILFDIKRYIERVNNENDKILYYAMINIIMDGKIELNFDELFEELDHAAKEKMNPTMLRNLILPLNQILDSIEKKADVGIVDYIIQKELSRSSQILLNESKKNLNLFKSHTEGKKGVLYPINNSCQNSFIFEFKDEKEKENKFKPINLNTKNLVKGNLYEYKEDKKKGTIYILSNDNNIINCILFDEE